MTANIPTRKTWKGHANPETVTYFGRGAKPDAAGVQAKIQTTPTGNLKVVSVSTGTPIEWFGVASKFWAAPATASKSKRIVAAERANPAKVTVPVAATPAKTPAVAKATPTKTPAAKAAPATVKEMTREQKRAVAAVLIQAAADMLSNFGAVAAGLSPEIKADLDGVNAKVAGELVGTWLSYCPGTAWNAALGERPRSAAAK